MPMKLAVSGSISLVFVAVLIFSAPVAEASKVGEIIKVNAPPGVIGGTAEDVTNGIEHPKGDEIMRILKKRLPGVSDDMIKGMFREDESSPEREFTNPVGLDIQAGNHGVFISVEPPNADPVVILHENKG